MADDLDREIERAADVLAATRYCVALVGAGISVESGIPPFRGAGGLWTKHGEPPMDGYQRMLRDPAAYWQQMLARRGSDDEFARAINAAVPNPAHHALARLEADGVLRHTITQNIDNLHYVAGSVSVTEIHGNRTKVRCIECGARWRWEEFTVTDVPPHCPHCGGIVKSDTVMFGEPIPRAALAECHEQAERADCMLIAGTSATVTPAAWFPEMVLEHGGTLVEVNVDETPFSAHCAAVLRGPAGELLPPLADRVAQRRAPQDQQPGT
ncbi:MAG TPA: Sir2 family NAD-dependent protein deacetylase [Methylomirabilota bacterium]|nr:Sir2 family NAD-dependent protein deacetylase [Methylomirabilota bacterium]